MLLGLYMGVGFNWFDIIIVVCITLLLTGLEALPAVYISRHVGSLEDAEPTVGWDLVSFLMTACLLGSAIQKYASCTEAYGIYSSIVSKFPKNRALKGFALNIRNGKPKTAKINDAIREWINESKEKDGEVKSDARDAAHLAIRQLITKRHQSYPGLINFFALLIVVYWFGVHIPLFVKTPINHNIVVSVIINLLYALSVWASDLFDHPSGAYARDDLRDMFGVISGKAL